MYQGRIQRWALGLAVMLALLASGTAANAQLRFVRIGDVDGFGHGDGAGLLNADGDPCNVDGVDPLGLDDFLPDIDQDGSTMHFSGDDFDLRSAAEIIGASITTLGFIDTGSGGAQFTDLTLSQSYDTTYGTPNDFPDPPSTDRNNSVFIFDVEIDADTINPCTEVYFNIVFGDIGGGVPSDLILTFADATSITEEIEPINPNVEDGLIRGAFLQISFDDVFTLNGPVYEGYLRAELKTLPGQSGGDPFYAVDFAELSTITVNSCFGDVDLNGTVNIDDLLQLLAAWGPCTDPCDPDCRADLIEDGVINIKDALILLSAWGDCL